MISSKYIGYAAVLATMCHSKVSAMTVRPSAMTGINPVYCSKRLEKCTYALNENPKEVTHQLALCLKNLDSSERFFSQYHHILQKNCSPQNKRQPDTCTSELLACEDNLLNPETPKGKERQALNSCLNELAKFDCAYVHDSSTTVFAFLIATQVIGFGLLTFYVCCNQIPGEHEFHPIPQNPPQNP